jgi:hypothetical protein
LFIAIACVRVVELPVKPKLSKIYRCNISLPPKWLGRQDSNLRMPGSKPGALPLGDAPILMKLIACRHLLAPSRRSPSGPASPFAPRSCRRSHKNGRGRAAPRFSPQAAIASFASAAMCRVLAQANFLRTQ